MDICSHIAQPSSLIGLCVLGKKLMVHQAPQSALCLIRKTRQGEFLDCGYKKLL